MKSADPIRRWQGILATLIELTAIAFLLDLSVKDDEPGVYALRSERTSQDPAQ